MTEEQKIFLTSTAQERMDGIAQDLMSNPAFKAMLMASVHTKAPTYDQIRDLIMRCPVIGMADSVGGETVSTPHTGLTEIFQALYSLRAALTLAEQKIEDLSKVEPTSSQFAQPNI